MVAASLGSSTTQMTVASRPGSRHTRQSSPSATFPHSRQKLTRSLALTMASASRLASSGAVFTRWKASRCADFGPMPGRRDSSSMRSWIGPSYTRQRPATGPLLVGDLGVQLGLEPLECRILVGGRFIVVLDEGDRADHGLSHDAGDLRR